MMQRACFLAVVSTALVALFAVSGCVPGKPAIVVDGEKYLFGNVKEGDQVVFTFMFRNAGHGDLVIEEVFISCDCVEVREYDKITKPGKKGTVYGVVDTTGFMGPVVKAIRLTTNAAPDPVVLTLEGTIVERVK